MRHLPIVIGIAALLLVGCGEDTKNAARETAKSAGRLAGAMVSDAAAATIDIAKEAATGAGEVAKEKGNELAEKAKEVAKDTRDAVAKKAKETADSAKKSVKK